MRRDALIHGRLDGPASLAGVRDAAPEVCQGGIGQHGVRGQVEQPRGDDAAATPYLGHVGQVKVVAVQLRVAQGAGLGVDGDGRGTCVGMMEDVESLRVGGHDPVLDPVVDHLHEVAGPARTAVEVALLGRAATGLAPLRPRCGPDPGGERPEDGVQPLYCLVWPADHQAVASLQAEDAAAGAAVDVEQPLLGHAGGPPDVVAVVGIAAVDDGVAFRQVRHELGERVVDGGRGHHEPDGPGRRQLFDEVLQRRRSGRQRAVGNEPLDRFLVARVAHHLVSAAQEAA